LNRISADLSRVEIYLSDQFSKYSLPGNRISALLEDQRGLIWIGTWTGGVARFDPRSEAFGLIQSVPNQKQSLPSNQVGHIAFDQAGAMWAGLVDSRGLVRLNADGLVDTLVDQQRFPNLLSAEVSAIHKRREGGVWFGTLRAGVYAFDEHRQVLSELDHAGAEKLEQASVLSLLEEAQGALWIGTLNEGLWYRCASCTQWRNFRFDPSNPRSLGGDSVAAMAMNHGKLYLGLRRAGLNILTLDAIEQGFQRIEANPNDSSALAHPSISSLSFAADGGLWLATPLGLHRMDTATGLFTRFGKTQGLLSESVSCIIQGADGKAWFSSNGSIASIDQAGNQLAVFSALDGVTGFDFFSGSCARGPDGTLYFGGLHGITSVHPSRLPTPSAPPQVLIKRIEVGGRRMEPQTTAKPLLLAHHQNQLTLELAVDDFREPSAVSFRYRLADQQDFSELPAGQSSILLAGLAAGSYPVELQARFLGQQSFGPVSRVLVEVALPPWRRGWHCLWIADCHVVGGIGLARAPTPARTPNGS
jgi:streptogramin lyase